MLNILSKSFQARDPVAKIRSDLGTPPLRGRSLQKVRRIRHLSYTAVIIKKGGTIVNIGLLIIMLIGGLAGILSTLYLLVSLPLIIIQKIYRKVRFGIPMMK